MTSAVMITVLKGPPPLTVPSYHQTKDVAHSNVTPHPVRGSAEHHRNRRRPDAVGLTGQPAARKDK